MDRLINTNKEMGTCPFCGSDDYERQDDDVLDDAIFLRCTCLAPNCGKRFKETFVLKVQSWETEEDE